jgi:signal peptidase I
MGINKRLIVILFIISSVIGIPEGDNKLAYGEENIKRDCILKIKLSKTRGSSLVPLIKSKQKIKILYGYYDCHPIEREDIVAYYYSGNDVPIIKIVKALPGDKWRLRKNGPNRYYIIVNNKPLKTSNGEFYQIPESKINMLKLYVRSYPLIPKDTYLILGNHINGTMDATRFGLVDKSDIIGKVVIFKEAQ